jgi:hypothetical protein
MSVKGPSTTTVVPAYSPATAFSKNPPEAIGKGASGITSGGLVGSAGLGVAVGGTGVGVALGPQAARIMLTATNRTKIVNSERFIFTLLLVLSFFLWIQQDMTLVLSRSYLAAEAWQPAL